jgi:protein Tex
VEKGAGGDNRFRPAGRGEAARRPGAGGGGSGGGSREPAGASAMAAAFAKLQAGKR